MQSSLLDEVKRFVCSDIPRAVSAFAYIGSSSGFLCENVVDTLEYLGLSRDEAVKLYRELIELLGKYLETESIEELRSRVEALKGVIEDCFRSLNIAEEARRRIRSLPEDELRILRMAALGIVKKAERPRLGPLESWHGFDSVDIANFVSAMLSRDVDYRCIERLFARTLLAVKHHSASRRRRYYTMKFIRENLGIIKELAASVADELPSYEYVRSRLEQLEPYQIAALLNPREDFYKAVYGFKVEDVLKSLTVEKIVYKGIANEFVKNEIRKIAEELAQRRCHELMVEYLAKALESLDYEVDLEHRGFESVGYSCRYTAARPGTTIYVYIHPFAVSPPIVSRDERIVIVVEGMGAEIPRCLEEWRKSYPYLARLADALWIAIHRDGIYVFESTVREGWQREIVEGLGRALRNVYMVKASGELEALPAAPTAAPPISESMLGATAITPLQPMVRGVVESREILESIVAKALQAMGFELELMFGSLLGEAPPSRSMSGLRRGLATRSSKCMSRARIGTGMSIGLSSTKSSAGCSTYRKCLT